MPSYRWPEELPCYQEARRFRIAVAYLCMLLPKTEEFRLKDQMLRAARSVTANIAEGFGRHHHQENIQFCRQARGSLIEMRDHLNTAADEGFVESMEVGNVLKMLESSLASLNGYLVYLKKCASDSKIKQSPITN